VEVEVEMLAEVEAVEPEDIELHFLAELKLH
jgi:hypothetical protein